MQDSRAENHVDKQKWEEEEREKDADQGPHFSFSSARQDSDSDFWRRQEEEYKKRRDDANREKQRQEESDRQEARDQDRFRQERDKIKRDMEERERAERERREADERERRERERREQEERERERRENEARENERRARDKEEQERKAREDQERREREERERLDNDPRIAEERRRKDELLRRLQALDTQSNDPFAPASSKPANKSAKAGGDADDPVKRSRDPFVFSRSDSAESARSSKKDYTFTRTVENMHQGKPSHDDVSVPYLERQKRARNAKEDAEIGGYQPSFVGSGKSASQKKPLSLFDDDKKPEAQSSGKQEKKSKLMSDLFGPQVGSKTSAKATTESEDFFLTNKKPTPSPTKRTTGFPWEDKSPTKVGDSSRREGSTLFGGGAALVDDEPNTGGNSAMLLPRRPRQSANAFPNKLSVTAVDNLDDSLEEVIL